LFRGEETDLLFELLPVLPFCPAAAFMDGPDLTVELLAGPDLADKFCEDVFLTDFPFADLAERLRAGVLPGGDPECPLSLFVFCDIL
jgi:hypothetical protein